MVTMSEKTATLFDEGAKNEAVAYEMPGGRITPLSPEEQLAAPMPFRWKPQGKPIHENGRWMCLGVPYINAAEVKHRLNEVFGFDGWFAVYEQIAEYCIPGASEKDKPVYVCALKCEISVLAQRLEMERRIDARWIRKGDVGSADGPTPESARMSAYSHTLKRAAAMFGVGYFLESIRNEMKPCQTRQYGQNFYFVAWEEEGVFPPGVGAGPVLPEARAASSPPPNPAPSGWAAKYPRIRDDTRALLQHADKFGVDWTAIEAHYTKAIPSLSRDEVRDAINLIRTKRLTGGAQ